MSTYSSDLRIELITNGSQAGTWGTTTNNTLAYVIDPSITGFQTVSVTSANQALTYVSGSTSTASANQAIYASLAFTTSTGANFNVYAPPNPKQYIIWNNSSYTLTIYNSSVIGNTTAAGTGVQVPAGKKIQVFSDGTSFYAVDASNLTGTLAIANGGTGQTTQQAAINALAGATTSGQYLRGNGTNVTMSAIQAADVPTLNQNTTGTAAGLSATLAVGSGGTGQTTQQAAINALAGATTSGYYLRGNGTNAVMAAIQAGDVPTLNQNTTGTAAGLSATLVVGSGGTGATSLSGVVYGNGSSAFTAATGSQIASAIGSSTVTNATNVVSGGTIASNVTATTQTAGTNNTTVATTAFVQAAVTGGPNVQVFTSSGTFTVPTNITSLKVSVFGGGGGGRGAAAGAVTGGGSGGCGQAVLTGLTPGASITVTVGGGGAGGSSGGNGSAGGTSSFGAYASSTGGAGATGVDGADGVFTTTGTRRYGGVTTNILGGGGDGSPGIGGGGCCAPPSAVTGGGGGGMSGGGGGAPGSSGAFSGGSGGVAYGPGSNGSTASSSGGSPAGAGGGTAGGAGGGVLGGGGGGTGGVIVEW